MKTLAVEYPHKTYLYYKKTLKENTRNKTEGLIAELWHWRWMQEQDADRELELRIQEKFREFW